MAATRYRIAIDAHCGFCRRSAGWLKTIDWLDRIDIDPVHEPEMLEMRVTRSRDGVTKGGFEGFRLFAPAVPLLLPSWPFLFLPGVPTVGRIAYRWIAKHRGELPGGCDSTTCDLPP